MQYLFILGSSPRLSQAEIESVLNTEFPRVIFPGILLTAEGLDLNPPELINRLGGTVKIAELREKNADRNSLVNSLVLLLSQISDNKITFGLSFYGKIPLGNIKDLNRQVKISLDEKGIKSRFILPTEGNLLSSVQVAKEKIREIIIIENDGSFILAQTVAVQNFEDWGTRDYQRPFANPKSGMLPPKVARMMLNLAIADRGADTNPVILDPFCGVGTVGAESLMLNCWSFNSDQDKDAVEKTAKNLEWLCKKYTLNPENFKVYQKNAANIDEILPPASLDAVVTEPFLGPSIELKNKLPYINRKQRLTPGKLENIITGLERMYLGSLKAWVHLLKPGGRVVIIYPSFQLWGQEIFMKNIIDTCEKLGYNIEAGPFEYARPQAIVKRQIYILKKGINSESKEQISNY